MNSQIQQKARMPDIQHLFVYGTLLSEQDNPMSALLRANSLPYGKGYFFGRLYFLGTYPGAILDSTEKNKVFGEVVQLKQTHRTLQKLDFYEDVSADETSSGLFRREIVEVFMENEKIHAWVYVYNRSINNKQEILSGDYMEFLSSV